MGSVTGPAAPDAPAPDWLLAALERAFGRWLPSLPQRLEAVVPIPSTRNPRLVQSLASTIASGIGVPLVEAITLAGPPPGPDLSPAARACAQAGRISLVAGESVPEGPVLLVDETWRSGWTATLSGALLREAGARSVTPFAAHQLP
jgi:ATP-dependent DNA helicase RecQ